MWYFVGFLVIAALLYYGLRDTEEGWEDEGGYHKGKQP